MKMIVKCQINGCPYNGNGYCEKRMVAINEYGLCNAMFKGQQVRQLRTDWEYIRNPNMFVDLQEEKKKEDNNI